MRAMNSPGGEAAILNLIGGALDQTGRKAEALENFKRALELFRGVDRFGEVQLLINIGGLHLDPGDRQNAINYFNQAMPIAQEINDRLAVASVLNSMATISAAQGDKKQALEKFKQALAINRAVGDRQKEIATLGNSAKTEQEIGDPVAARASIEAALDIVESLRGKLASENLRASYFANAHAYYEFEIELLMSMHKRSPAEQFNLAALQVGERARARSLNELLIESHANIREGVDAKLLASERSLRDEINAKAFLRRKLNRIPNTEQQAATLAKETEGLLSELQQVEGMIRQKNPQYASLSQFKPLNGKEAQSLLDRDTLLLEYSLGTEHSYLWSISATEIASFELPARREIESAAGTFVEILKTETPLYAQTERKVAGAPDVRREEILEGAARLSRMLLGPVSGRLGNKRLVIIADGLLQTVPFAALPDIASNTSIGAMQPLMMRHEIVNLPSLAVLATLRSSAGGSSPTKDLVVLADPVFSADDERVKPGVVPIVQKTAPALGIKRDGELLPRLTSSRKEAEGIAALLPEKRVKKALDFEASRTLVNSGELSQYRYVHFATHGLLDNQHPELTSVVLSLVDQNGNSQDGFFRAHEVYNLKLSADVVVLSACETGLGKAVRGEGLIGLTRGFMYAGAKRVVVSLWSVRDESTAQLMVIFYRELIKGRKSPASALRAAQMEMFRSEKWRAPHYWAAFVLQGEWK